METNSNYIESGLILNCQTITDLRRIRHPVKDFALQGDAFTFLTEYIYEYSEQPPISLLKEKYPDLDESSVGLDIGFCLKEFKQQILRRGVVSLYQKNKTILVTDPVKALNEISSGIQDLVIEAYDDLVVYDTGEEERYEEYLERKRIKEDKRLAVRGVITPFRSVNKTGIGWEPGTMNSLYASTEMGKTWVSLAVAAAAVNQKKRVLLISPEMTTDQISLRLDVVLGNMMGYSFSHHDLDRGFPIDEDEYKKYLTESNAKRFFLCDSMNEAGLSVKTIAAQVKHVRPDILIVDGAELVHSKGGEPWIQNQNLFFDMKTLAISNKIPVFITYQANMQKAKDPFVPPSITSVANGQGLMRSSDFVLSMCRVEDDDDLRLMKVQKQRSSRTENQYWLMDWNVNVGVVKESEQVFSFD